MFGFDFDLFQCGQCARYWVNTRCAAGGAGPSWEPATVEDAETMQALEGDELRAFMKKWAEPFA